MSELVPADAVKGAARFDGQSLAIQDHPYSVFPEAGGPTGLDQTGPYTMTGQKWLFKGPPLPVRRNAFSITLTGASAVGIDVARMRLDPRRAITGDVDADHALRLRLRGLRGATTATLDGRAIALRRNAKAVIVTIPAGKHRLVLRHAAGS